MKHLKSEFDKLSFKEFFLYGLVCVCMAAAITAIFLGMYLPPMGEIHPSIITYFGISSAFAGSIVGINIHYKNKVEDFKAEIRDAISHDLPTAQ